MDLINFELYFAGFGSPYAQPFHVGKTDLACVSNEKFFGKRRFKRSSIGRYKRKAPSVNPWNPTHSWIYFHGYYFEFGITNRIGEPLVATISQVRPAWGDKCRHDLRRGKTRYTYLSLDCVARCTRNYKSVFGRYHLFLNNCHHFVNLMSHAMCHTTTCPAWCG